MDTKLRDFVSKKLIVLHEEDTVYSAARAMKDNNIGCVLVCDRKGALTGIVTDRDIVLRSICEGMDPGMIPVRHVMTPEPVSIDENHNVKDAVSLMRKHGYRRLPVVNSETKKATGIVSMDDLILAKAADRDGLSDMVRRQIHQPTRLNPEGDKRQRNGFTTGVYSVSPEFFHDVVEESRARLHEARLQQSYGKMLHLAQICLEEEGMFTLNRPCVEMGMRFFLELLVRRVVPGAAENLISQLPAILHEDLYSQPAGPDVGISLAVIQRCVRKATRVKPRDSAAVVRAFARTLVAWVSHGEIQAFCAQLPLELRALFEEELKKEKRPQKTLRAS